MKPRLRHQVLAVVCVAVSAATFTAGDAAGSNAGRTRTGVVRDASVITTRGVGALRIGDTIKALHRKDLIGGVRKGCELEPGQQVAPLRRPLVGWAVFAGGKRRLTGLGIEGGAETRSHIEVGATVTELRDAYPAAEYRPPGSMDPFPEGFLSVPDISHPRLTFIVEPESRRVEAIEIPSPNFCE
jgi:hypothetical protein